MSTWILVADASRARVFASEHSNQPLVEMSDILNPDGRLHESEMTTDTDTRGRAPNGAGSHGLGDAPPVKEELMHRFAQQLCAQLEHASQQGKFGRLYMVAPPHFLGILRKHRSQELDRSVVGDIAKDICTGTATEIRDHLPRYL